MKHITKLFLVGFLATGLVGCLGGSGSSGGGDGGDGGGVTYTGKSEPATLNSSDEVNGLYQEVLGISQFASADELSPFTTSIARSAVKKSINKSARLVDKRYSPKATESIDETIPGDTGSFRVRGTVNYDDATHELIIISANVVVTWNEYCEYELCINGSAKMEMSEDRMSMTFTRFSYREGNSVDFLLGGSLVAEDTADGFVTTANITAHDRIEDIQAKMQNYVTKEYEEYEAASYGSTDYLNEQGRIYHSDYGYVDVTTLEDMKLNWWGKPVSGKVKIAGASVYIIEYNDSGYSIGRDTTGDNQADTDFQSYNY